MDSEVNLTARILRGLNDWLTEQGYKSEWMGGWVHVVVEGPEKSVHFFSIAIVDDEFEIGGGNYKSRVPMASPHSLEILRWHLDLQCSYDKDTGDRVTF